MCQTVHVVRIDTLCQHVRLLAITQVNEVRVLLLLASLNLPPLRHVHFAHIVKQKLSCFNRAPSLHVLNPLL